MEAVKVPLKAPVRSMAALEEALASADHVTRAEAAFELAGAGVVSESVGNRLRQALLGDADARVRAAAVWALGHVRQGAVQADGKLQPVPYDEPPRLVQQPRLVYPQAAFDQGIEGTVVVEIVVDEEGKVDRADVRESIPALDAAALGTIGEWRFAPAKLAGKPICTMASLPVTFRIRAQK